MAIVTSDFLAGLFTTFRVIWEDAFLAASSANPYEKYCTVVDSTTDTESYNWLGTVPKMRQWLDQRQLSGLYSFNYSLKNLHYEVSLEVDRDTLEDDKYNTIQPRLAQLGQEAGRWPWELAVNAIINGATTGNNSYDGVTFFNSSHVVGINAAQTNLVSATGQTLATVRADLISGRTQMRRVKDDQGRPMNLKPDLVIVPPDLTDVFEQLVHTNLIGPIGSASATPTNVLLNAVDVMTDALLTNTTTWYLMSTSNVIKPLLFQWRKKPEFVAVNNPNDALVFQSRKFWYGVDLRAVAGYGLWEMAIKVA